MILIKNIAILMTCFNRREKTLAAIKSILQNKLVLPIGVDVEIYLVDDGSTDGTSDAIGLNFPFVKIIKSRDNLFWNKGMHLAFEEARKLNYDAYLWLNDDTNLYANSIERLLIAHDELLSRVSVPCLVVGSTVGENGVLSYGGSVSVGKFNPFKYKKVWSPDKLVECEAMNGNCVLIPKAVADKVGNLEYAFEHAMGDIDYSLRARRAGFKVFVLPGYVGECSVNSQRNTYADRTLSKMKRWKLMKSRKGLPFKSWLIFTRRHGGLLWPLYFVWPYFKLFLK